LPCAAAPSPVVPQQNSYTQNIVNFDRAIGIFQQIQALTFQTVPLIFSDGMQKWHMTKLITRKKTETHIIFGGKKIRSSFFSFKLAVHVFCATKIVRKTRNYQNILQEKLQAEL
jgi:hypothetical protein